MQKFKIFFLSLVTIMLLLVVLLLFTEWRPDEVERVDYACEEVVLPDTLSLMSWNIGYAGLGDDMDFFYDGGESTRTSKQRTEKNLRGIISHLKSFKDIDFILLQEVDVYSRRSYYMDQAKIICDSLDYPYSAFALNYNSRFVPIPLCEPMGRAKSGVLILSKYPICTKIRWQYPLLPPYPNRLFDLKRAMLSVGIKREKGDTLWVNNIHNTAFDSGEQRLREVQFISENIDKHPLSITAGDWNSTPPGYIPSREALENRYFSPLPLCDSLFAKGCSVAADLSRESVRYLDMPYSSKNSTTTLVDFAVLGKNCRIINYTLFNFYFVLSDHNPFIVKFLAN